MPRAKGLAEAGAGSDLGRGPAVTRADDLRGFLRGSWVFLRLLRDEATGGRGSFLGRADFTDAPGGLDFREAGWMVLGDYQGHAERRYRFRFTGPWRAEVGFADGRPFHALELRGGETTVEHLCGNDLYRGRYRLAGDYRWRLDWQITGPRKDLSLETCYQRFAEDTRPREA